KVIIDMDIMDGYTCTVENPQVVREVFAEATPALEE
ncbi:hypothetical protein EVA_16037, partial [gut metagenome]